MQRNCEGSSDNILSQTYRWRFLTVSGQMKFFCYSVLATVLENVYQFFALSFIHSCFSD